MSRYLLIASLVIVAGCSPVKAWQRGDLSHQEMQFNGDSLDARLNSHIYFSKEGASGEASIGGGGCGCN
ncbi:MAG: DUF4266 domain-containing protein [Methylococcales bacterium]|jgi:hypothetical protein|nr:DUF4266 domain-containing protein [Methylococcales bacterium]MBT7410421.1 DUF4266 domain-containing protein [Methylococcales bacterium]